MGPFLLPVIGETESWIFFWEDVLLLWFLITGFIPSLDLTERFFCTRVNYSAVIARIPFDEFLISAPLVHFCTSLSFVSGDKLTIETADGPGRAIFYSIG